MKMIVVLDVPSDVDPARTDPEEYLVELLDAGAEETDQEAPDVARVAWLGPRDAGEVEPIAREALGAVGKLSHPARSGVRAILTNISAQQMAGQTNHHLLLAGAVLAYVADYALGPEEEHELAVLNELGLPRPFPGLSS